MKITQLFVQSTHFFVEKIVFFVDSHVKPPVVANYQGHVARRAADLKEAGVTLEDACHDT
jgi:hypothetical protein